MFSKFAVVISSIALLISSCAAPTDEVEDHTGHITVENQVLLVDTNNHDERVTLTDATSEVADSIKLAPNGDGIEIAGGETLVLAENSEYLQLTGLDKSLIAGSEITVTLGFSDGHAVEVLVPVKIKK